MVSKIYKKVKKTLFRHPHKLLKEEREHVNKSFYFRGSGEEAVLLIHGWTSTAYEVRRLGKYLSENGYTARGPMLRGHGKKPKDLEKVSWEDWLKDVEREYLRLKEKHSKVYVAGTSIGSCLAIMLAEKHHDIAGLILMATPYKIKFEKISVLLAKITRVFFKYNKKYYPPTFGSRKTITRLISYQEYPIDSALETFELIKAAREKVSAIKQPCFVLQSLSDHIVTRHSLKDVYNTIKSKKKKKKYIKRAYHTFISDIRNENVFQDILEFIKTI